MSLDLTEFGLDEAQIAQINAEIDRERTRASQTARANAEKDFNEKLPVMVQEAVLKATADASKTAEEQAREAFQQQLAEMNAQLAQVTRDRNRSLNESQIRRAGVTDDATVASFAEMFADKPDALGGFLETFSKSVEAGVKAASQAALSGATPPGAAQPNPSGGQVTKLNQTVISQMVDANAKSNGGFIDDAQLLADLRMAQTNQQV